MPDACTVIINPLSGSFSPQRLSAALDFLVTRGFTPHLQEVSTPESAVEIAQTVCRSQQHPLIIVGAGDGTINAVVNGLTPGIATLAVIPFGTSNVLCRELGIMSMEQALEKIAGGVSRSFCIGQLEKGETQRTFLLMAGVGFDGRIVKGVAPREKRLLKKGAYLLSALRVLCSWETDRLQVVSDSRVVDCHSVIVCNGAKYGGNILLAPGASLFKQELQVICILNGSRLGYLRTLPALIAGRGLKSTGIVTFPATELEVRGTKPLQADGDYYFDSPVRIRSIPDFLKIMV
ncbi:MAG: YegS/Rv2252/BmrU family lipid kinase [Geobacteraceae bacterium]|nr:YegS/Rv2252/BmrU family lipid kinase [Geobacteraceae bacterium]